MDKISKSDMLYTFVDAQGIRDIVNTRTSSSSPTHATVPYPTRTVATLVHMLEVDQLAYVAYTLMMRDPTPPIASTNMDQEDEPQSPWIDTSKKLTRVAKDNDFEEVTPFIKISYILFLTSHALFSRLLLSSRYGICPSSRIYLKGIKWKWLMSFLTACPKLLLLFISPHLDGVIIWPRVILLRKGILGKGRLKDVISP